MKQFFLSLIRRIRSVRIRWENAMYIEERRLDVISACLDEASPLANKPYIMGGTFEWYVESPIQIDFFFPDTNKDTNIPGNPLAIRVAGQHYGPYDLTEEHAVNRAFWEAATREDAYIADVCYRAGIPLLLVTPNDPIDPYSIAIQIRKLLNHK